METNSFFSIKYPPPHGKWSVPLNETFPGSFLSLSVLYKHILFCAKNIFSCLPPNKRHILSGNKINPD